MKKPADIDEYITGFPEETSVILIKLRETIRKAAPGVVEGISYGIPAYRLNGKYIIYFAAFKKHIGIYPAPRGIEEFHKELAEYKGGKGTVQFPHGKPLPMRLISRIVKFRVKENLHKAKDKKI